MTRVKSRLTDFRVWLGGEDVRQELTMFPKGGKVDEAFGKNQDCQKG